MRSGRPGVAAITRSLPARPRVKRQLEIQVQSVLSCKKAMVDIVSLDGRVLITVHSLLNLKAAGAKLSFANLVEESLPGADLARADLSGADLSGAEFTGCTLNGANLAQVRAPYADFCNVAAVESDWYSSNLVGADMRRARLARASFHSCDLRGADLRGADLRFADFRNCRLEDCRFENAETSGAMFSS